MPEYLYPGVYVEEIDTGNKPIEGVSTSTAGFLGIAERGPITATLLTSFADYQRTYGSYVKEGNIDRYLTYAVEGFFQNGGLRCFVQRVAHTDSSTPGNSAKFATVTADGMTIAAVGPGQFGNRVAYQISDAGIPDPTLFKLTVSYWSGTPSPDLVSNASATEVFDNLSAVSAASTFYEGEINGSSNLVLVKQTAGGRPKNSSTANLQVSSKSGLSVTTALTAGNTLVITPGGGAAATFTATTNLGTLINLINSDTVVGAKAYLDASGNLNILDPQGRKNISVGGTLTELGKFAAATGSLGPPVLLSGGSDGLQANPNSFISANGGLAAALVLPDKEDLTLTSGAASASFAVDAAAGPIKILSDLIGKVSGDPIGATASLDSTGHLVIVDNLARGNLVVGGKLVASTLGAFTNTNQTASMSRQDFLGNDPNPFVPPGFTAAAMPVSKSGLAGLGDVDEISLLSCPDEYYFGTGDTTIAGYLRDMCEKMMDRFAILQAPANAKADDKNLPSVNSKYAAYYFPWLSITNPTTGVSTLVPPGGHMTGIYARSDNRVGVQKDPANEVIFNVDQLQLPIDDQKQAILNPKGVNCLRYFKGAGNLVWGGRTTSTDPDWKYINVRRIFIFVEKSIRRGTQWVVFESNFEPTWARVRRSVSDFLTGLWRDGVLQGAKKEQAFFVKCDNTTMTQADIDNGRLICVIGIAPVKPAEFVIFRIGQWYGGSDVTEQ